MRRRAGMTARVLLACSILAALTATASGFFAAGEDASLRAVERSFDLQGRRKVAIPWFRQQSQSRPIAAKTRGVLAIETSVGPVYLWVAPTRGGGSCQLIDIEANTLEDGSPNLSGICSPQPPRVDGPFVSGPVHGSTFTARGDVQLLHGRVRPDVASIEVRLAAGGTTTVRPEQGFFLRELTGEDEPTAVIARDRNGGELGRRAMQGPRSVRRDLPRPIGPYRTLIEIQTSAGFPMTFAVAPGTNGSVCKRTRYRGALAWGCGLGGDRVEPDAINVHPGLWNENEDGKPVVLLEGSVGRTIARLEVWYDAGDAARIPIVEQYVLFEVPRGLTPRVLVGLDANGAIVARRALR